MHTTFCPTDDDETVGYWTTLMDAEVSHKTLMAIIYCLLERTKQVSVNRQIFLCTLPLYQKKIYLKFQEREPIVWEGGREYSHPSHFLRVYVQYTYGCAPLS